MLLVDSGMPNGEQVLERWLTELEDASLLASHVGPEPSPWATGTLIKNGPGALGSTLLVKYLVSTAGMTTWRQSIADAVKARDGWWSQALLKQSQPKPTMTLFESEEVDHGPITTNRIPQILRAAASKAGNFAASVGLLLRNATDRLATVLVDSADAARIALAGPLEGDHLRVHRGGPLHHAEIRVERICEDAALLVVSKLDIEVDELLVIVLDQMVLAEPHPDGAAFLLLGLDSAACIVDPIEMTLTTRVAAAHTLNGAVAEAAEAGSNSLSESLQALLELVNWVPDARVHPEDLESALRSASCSAADAASMLEIVTTRTTSVFADALDSTEQALCALIENIKMDSRFNLGRVATASLERIEVFRRLVGVTVVRG
ncbi:MAG: hypothetical protein KIT24_11575 [Phycisphaeraceae bacterium]|nr:hypothetical protein [Phycisphaeraceae bacterium]